MSKVCKFRDSILKVMKNLTVSRSPESGEKILTKGLDAIFSEPDLQEEEAKYDKKLVYELMSLLKSSK